MRGINKFDDNAKSFSGTTQGSFLKLKSGTSKPLKKTEVTKIEKKLINGPYIHHMSEIYGSYADVLEEFTKFVPGLEFDDING